MEHKEIDKSTATAENCMSNFMLPGMTPEIADKSYEVIKAFAQLQEAVDRTSDTVAINSMMCVLIDMPQPPPHGPVTHDDRHKQYQNAIDKLSHKDWH